MGNGKAAKLSCIGCIVAFVAVFSVIDVRSYEVPSPLRSDARIVREATPPGIAMSDARTSVGTRFERPATYGPAESTPVSVMEETPRVAQAPVSLPPLALPPVSLPPVAEAETPVLAVADASPAWVAAEGRLAAASLPPIAAVDAAQAGNPQLVAETAAEQWYTIQANDSLFGIAKRYLDDGGRWQEIQRLNQSLDPAKIQPGMRIKLPPGIRIAQR